MKKYLMFIIYMVVSMSAEAQVPKKMIVEHFTNTLCPPCASRNPGFYANLNNQSNVLHLSIHSSTPYTQCLLYQQNSGPSDGRRFYYNINPTPSLVINGFNIPPANDYSQPVLFTPFQGQTSPVSIRMEQRKHGADSMDVRVIIKTEASHSLGTQQLWVGAAEDTVFYAGPNGEATHYDVFRGQMDLSSITIPTTVGDSLVYEYKLYSNAIWDFNRIFAFAMLQNVSNKSVTQSESTTPSTSNYTTTSIVQLPNTLNGVSVFPNPTKNLVTVKLENASETRMELFNWSGQLLQTSAFVETGALSLQDLPQGIYLLRLTNEGRTRSEKIVLE